MLCLTILTFLLIGPVATGSVEPKMATIGTLKAAATCMSPVSLVRKRLHLLINAMT